jgi:hypothetical protein
MNVHPTKAEEVLGNASNRQAQLAPSQIIQLCAIICA